MLDKKENDNNNIADGNTLQNFSGSEKRALGCQNYETQEIQQNQTNKIKKFMENIPEEKLP